jgi:hypothetical protein
VRLQQLYQVSPYSTRMQAESHHASSEDQETGPVAMILFTVFQR